VERAAGLRDAACCTRGELELLENAQSTAYPKCTPGRKSMRHPKATIILKPQAHNKYKCRRAPKPT
jgi:hypothetical protein